ncbi:MAG: glycosyltransferase family 4 protein [Pyrinomonadaceae bacterium]
MSAQIVLMKVLHLLDTVNRGGAETLVLDVCRNAEDYEIDLTFVTAQGGELEEDFRTSGADFIRLQRRFPVDFGAILKLRKIIKQRKIQIVHAHQAVDGLHLYLATIGLPVKRVLTFHGFITDAKNRRTLRVLIPQMNANIVVSRGLQKWLEKEDKLNVKQNFYVIYNGTDEKRLQPTGKSLKKELSLNEDVLLFGMIGNFYRDPRKDQMTLCQSLPKVFAEIKNAHCIFAGKTEAGAEEKFRECVEFCRKDGIAEKVHFLGVRDDIPDVLAALDLFVFSSLQEGLPIALTEAMLAGVPLIVSDIEPLLEASDNGKYAEVFPVKNAEVLSEKILKLLKDENLREDLANRALEFAKENFSIEAHLKELKKLYDSLLEKDF